MFTKWSLTPSCVERFARNSRHAHPVWLRQISLWSLRLLHFSILRGLRSAGLGFLGVEANLCLLANYEQVWSAHAKKKNYIQVHRFFLATQSSYPLVNKHSELENHHFCMGKSTTSMGHLYHRYVFSPAEWYDHRDHGVALRTSESCARIALSLWSGQPAASFLGLGMGRVTSGSTLKTGERDEMVLLMGTIWW